MGAPPEKRYVAIDGLRGLAAVYVVLFHVNWQTHIAPTVFVGNGYLAVDLFFVISGFVITAAYGDKILDRSSLGRFMVQRFFRIYPLHAVALAAFVALELARAAVLLLKGSVGGPLPFTGERSLELLLAHVFLLQGLGLTDKIGWNGPSWSISAEFVAYVLFGVVTAVALRLKRLLSPSFGLSVASGLYGLLIMEWGVIYGQPILRCVAGFVLGVSLFGLTSHTRLNHVLMRLPCTARNALEFALTSAMLTVLASCSGRPALAVVPLFAAMVLVAQADGGAVSRILTAAPFRFLGRISYSVYMVHILCLIPFTFVMKRLAGAEVYTPLPDGRPSMLVDVWVGDLAMFVAVGTVLLVSKYSYAWVEAPARHYGRTLAGRLGVASSAAVRPRSSTI